MRDNRRLKSVLIAFAGAMIPIGLTLGYNAVAFGSPLDTSYAHLTHSFSQQAHQHGLFGITFPSFGALYGVFISPARGLLLCAPIVALGGLGIPALWRRCRCLAVYVLISTIGYIFIVAGFDTWYGGWGFGPRLLLPVFGLAAISGATVVQRARSSSVMAAVVAAYISAGIAYNVGVSSMFPETPFSVKTPLSTVALPLAKMGEPSPNLGMTVLGLDGLASVAVLFMVVGALMGYVVWQQMGRIRLTPKSATTFVVTGLFFAILAVGPPEKMPANKAADLVEHLASRRIEAK